MKNVAMLVVALALIGVSPAMLAQTNEHTAHHSPQGTAASAPTSEGEVRKVDKEQGKITLRHGPIPNLDMPNMTMVFGVKDPAFLDNVKAGDKVRFTADKVNGVYTVTSIEPAK